MGEYDFQSLVFRRVQDCHMRKSVCRKLLALIFEIDIMGVFAGFLHSEVPIKSNCTCIVFSHVDMPYGHTEAFKRCAKTENRTLQRRFGRLVSIQNPASPSEPIA